MVPPAFSWALAVMATSSRLSRTNFYWQENNAGYLWNIVDMEDSTDGVNKLMVTVYAQDVLFGHSQ